MLFACILLTFQFQRLFLLLLLLTLVFEPFGFLLLLLFRLGRHGILNTIEIESPITSLAELWT